LGGGDSSLGEGKVPLFRRGKNDGLRRGQRRVTRQKKKDARTPKLGQKKKRGKRWIRKNPGIKKRKNQVGNALWQIQTTQVLGFKTTRRKRSCALLKSSRGRDSKTSLDPVRATWGKKRPALVCLRMEGGGWERYEATINNSWPMKRTRKKKKAAKCPRKTKKVFDGAGEK